VHRLTDLGAVVTFASDGTSEKGFAAEWRGLNILTVNGDLIDRGEILEETDIETALARFDELRPTAPQLKNAASEALARFRECFSARDWDAIADTVSLAFFIDDRRLAVNSGIEQGRDAVIQRMRATSDPDNTYVKSTTVATRGERLVLTSASYSRNNQGPETFRTELLSVVETDADGKLAAQIVFDPDDIDAAFTELEARYLAGEAAGSEVWSEVAQSYAAMNRHKIPLTMSNWTTVDHRVRETFDGGDLAAYTRSAWELIPDVSIRIETVHRLSDRGAVATQVASGTSEDGLEAEWRMIVVLVVRGEGHNRCELFDEAELNTALARFAEI
jgi:hypothetical protein